MQRKIVEEIIEEYEKVKKKEGDPSKIDANKIQIISFEKVITGLKGPQFRELKRRWKDIKATAKNEYDIIAAVRLADFFVLKEPFRKTETIIKNELRTLSEAKEGAIVKAEEERTSRLPMEGTQVKPPKEIEKSALLQKIKQFKNHPNTTAESKEKIEKLLHIIVDKKVDLDNEVDINKINNAVDIIIANNNKVKVKNEQMQIDNIGPKKETKSAVSSIPSEPIMTISMLLNNIPKQESREVHDFEEKIDAAIQWFNTSKSNVLNILNNLEQKNDDTELNTSLSYDIALLNYEKTLEILYDYKSFVNDINKKNNSLETATNMDQVKNIVDFVNRTNNFLHSSNNQIMPYETKSKFELVAMKLLSSEINNEAASNKFMKLNKKWQQEKTYLEAMQYLDDILNPKDNVQNPDEMTALQKLYGCCQPPFRELKPLTPVVLGLEKDSTQYMTFVSLFERARAKVLGIDYENTVQQVQPIREKEKTMEKENVVTTFFELSQRWTSLETEYHNLKNEYAQLVKAKDFSPAMIDTYNKLTTIFTKMSNLSIQLKKDKKITKTYNNKKEIDLFRTKAKQFLKEDGLFLKTFAHFSKIKAENAKSIGRLSDLLKNSPYMIGSKGSSLLLDEIHSNFQAMTSLLDECESIRKKSKNKGLKDELKDFILSEKREKYEAETFFQKKMQNAAEAIDKNLNAQIEYKTTLLLENINRYLANPMHDRSTDEKMNAYKKQIEKEKINYKKMLKNYTSQYSRLASNDYKIQQTSLPFNMDKIVSIETEVKRFQENLAFLTNEQKGIANQAVNSIEIMDGQLRSIQTQPSVLIPTDINPHQPLEQQREGVPDIEQAPGIVKKAKENIENKLEEVLIKQQAKFKKREEMRVDVPIEVSNKIDEIETTINRFIVSAIEMDIINDNDLDYLLHDPSMKSLTDAYQFELVKESYIDEVLHTIQNQFGENEWEEADKNEKELLIQSLIRYLKNTNENISSLIAKSGQVQPKLESLLSQIKDVSKNEEQGFNLNEAKYNALILLREQAEQIQQCDTNFTTELINTNKINLKIINDKINKMDIYADDIHLLNILVSDYAKFYLAETDSQAFIKMKDLYEKLISTSLADESIEERIHALQNAYLEAVDTKLQNTVSIVTMDNNDNPEASEEAWQTYYNFHKMADFLPDDTFASAFKEKLKPFENNYAERLQYEESRAGILKNLHEIADVDVDQKTSHFKFNKWHTYTHAYQKNQTEKDATIKRIKTDYRDELKEHNDFIIKYKQDCEAIKDDASQFIDIIEADKTANLHRLDEPGLITDELINDWLKINSYDHLFDNTNELKKDAVELEKLKGTLSAVLEQQKLMNLNLDKIKDKENTINELRSSIENLNRLKSFTEIDFTKVKPKKRALLIENLRSSYSYSDNITAHLTALNDSLAVVNFWDKSGVLNDKFTESIFNGNKDAENMLRDFLKKLPKSCWKKYSINIEGVIDLCKNNRVKTEQVFGFLNMQIYLDTTKKNINVKQANLIGAIDDEIDKLTNDIKKATQAKNELQASPAYKDYQKTQKALGEVSELLSDVTRSYEIMAYCYHPGYIETAKNQHHKVTEVLPTLLKDAKKVQEKYPIKAQKQKHASPEFLKTIGIFSKIFKRKEPKEERESSSPQEDNHTPKK